MGEGENGLTDKDMGIVSAEKENDEMSAEKTLEYVGQIGRDFSQYALELRAMIEEAKERGVNIDLSNNPNIIKFRPMNEYEMALVNMRSDLIRGKEDFLNAGLLMTQEDMNKRLEKMKQEGKN